MSVADVFARVTPSLAGRRGSLAAARLHARLVRRSGGRLGGTMLGAPVLVLRTTGRRSGRVREAPLLFARHGDAWAIAASNGASERFPAWWLNLSSSPDADILVDGEWIAVRAREAHGEEAQEIWDRLDRIYVGYAHYRSLAKRHIPVVVLERR